MTSRTSLTGLALSLAAFLSCFVCSAHADPNTARAARLTYVQGAVSIVEPNNAATVPGELNLPLLAGVQVDTGADGQAEVEFEDGSVVRLTPNSALSLDTLRVQPDGVFLTDMSLLQGLAYCELRATAQFQYTLAAGGDVLSPEENTTVRVDFDAPPASFAVLDGTAHVERLSAANSDGPNHGYQADVRAGETLRGDPGNPSRYFLTQQIAGDSWDQWNEDLDQAATAQSSDSTQVRNGYAGAQGYGWSDLDANGNWYDVPGQGPVWQPYSAADDASFDPYGNGAWVWYPGAGYVWASSYAWGWTPYRCGNWNYYNSFGWGWVPGTACGGLGWGFGGGGRLVNVIGYPPGYRPIHVPIGVGRPRPIVPVNPLSLAQQARPAVRVPAGPRQIAGATAQPVQRTVVGPGPSGPLAGASLRRDYPIDAASRAPAMGLASTSPTAVRTSTGMRPMPVGGGAAVQGERPAQSSYAGSGYPAGASPRPAQPARPQPVAPPVQRYQPPVQRQERSAPPQASRPAYTPPPARPAPAASPAPARSSPR